MTKEDAFVMPWSVPEDQWEKARTAMAKHPRGSAYDRRGLARYYLLYGDVDFVYNGKYLYGDAYGSRGINVSLIDFALALADGSLKREFAPGATTKYEQLDDDLQIEFSGEEDSVRITASDLPLPLVVPRHAFEHGVRMFLSSLANAIKAHLEGALDWESMAPLKELAVRFGTN